MIAGALRTSLTVLLVVFTYKSDDPPVKLDPIPAGLPASVETSLTARREELRALGRKLNEALDSFGARCGMVRKGEIGFDACMDEKRQLQCGVSENNSLRTEFNLELEAAARAAGVASSLTLTDVAIEGEVEFPIPDGTQLVDGRIPFLRVSVGTTIKTGPTGKFRAGVPGGQPFEVGGGATVTLDNTFLNPRATDKVDVDLTHGFFRFLRQAVDGLKGTNGRYRVRRQATCAVRG